MKDEDWDNANAMLHAAPSVAIARQLAPVEADWFDCSSIEICERLGDHARNGDRDMTALAEYLDHDLNLRWTWNPGGDREPGPYSLQENVNDILIWGVVGMPCPESWGDKRCMQEWQAALSSSPGYGTQPNG